MVSERWRTSYAAVVITGNGESNQPPNPTSSMSQPSIAATSHNASQRGLAEDIENPLHLSTNENPNNILVSPPLTGSSNYGSWSIAMQAALEVKNKWSLLGGSIEPPEKTQPHYAAWRRCNLMIKSWILKSVHPTIAQSVIYMDVAKDVWNDLKKRFSQRDPHRICVLQDEIYKLKQGNYSVNEYYKKSRSLWEEMNEMRPLPICQCIPHCSCSCDLIDQVRKDREIDQIIRFLQGLHEDYNPLKSSVLVLDPLPEMHKVYVMAEKFERQLGINNSSLEISHANAVLHEPNTSEETVAAVSYYNGRRNMNSNGGNKSAKCTYCGMVGHTVEKCYKKHGYPPGWIPGFKSRGKQSSTMAATASSENSAVTNNVVTSEQLQTLISLLQTQAGQKKSSVTAAVSLVPKFDKAKSHDEGKYIQNSHICSINLYSNMWILDSGATDHIVCSREFFDDYDVVEGTIVNLPNGENVTVRHKGNIKLADGLHLQEALHIPEFKFNIVSVSKLLKDSSHTLIFDSDQSQLQSHGKITGFARQDKGLAFLSPTLSLCHVIFANMLSRNDHLFPLSSTTTNRCFDLIHTDIWGPFVVKSLEGERYFLTIVDDYSRYTWIHLLKTKSETRAVIKSFHKYVQTQYSANIKILRSDNGMEFKMADFFSENGIVHQTSCVYTPQQNAVVERKHQHLLSVARALRFQSNMPLEFWGLCILYAAYIINRVPSAVIDWDSPYQRLHNKEPNLDKLRVFGCLSYAATLPQSRHKMASRSKKCVFVGMPANIKGYLLYDLQSGSTFISRDVIFFEDYFPMAGQIDHAADHDQLKFNPSLPNIHISGDDYSADCQNRPRDSTTYSHDKDSPPIMSKDSRLDEYLRQGASDDFHGDCSMEATDSNIQSTQPRCAPINDDDCSMEETDSNIQSTQPRCAPIDDCNMEAQTAHQFTQPRRSNRQRTAPTRLTDY
ncbi:PREDICTED: uncharacterized protein LOC109162697 [Ipomoea nil]|uniref:uncharacterized protein LOC109162697 n=1 Tax=Ipomoea nil TaxID=35883 RepID=UPI0009010B65|nr:PREDICTED: uncharacterized protein LOC109162697 [Ipomoea nil]